MAKLCRLVDYVSPGELAQAVASLRHRLAGDAAPDAEAEAAVLAAVEGPLRQPKKKTLSPLESPSSRRS